MQILLMIPLLIYVSGNPVPPDDTTKIDRTRMNDILWSVLDTLRSVPDSSAFSNPLASFPQELRQRFTSQLLQEGFGFPPISAFYHGIDMATRDILQGNLTIKHTGEMIAVVTFDGISWSTEPVYKHVLRTRYGVKLEAVPSGPLSKWYNLFADGYNSVSAAVLNRYYNSYIQCVAWRSLVEIIKREGPSFRDQWIYRP